MRNNFLLAASFLFLIGCTSGFQSFNGSGVSTAGTTATGTGSTGTGGTGSTAANPVVQLSWTANPGQQQGFYIEQSSDGVNFTQIQNVLDGTYTANVTGLTAGATYYFRIRSYNQDGDSAYATVASLTVNL